MIIRNLLFQLIILSGIGISTNLGAMERKNTIEQQKKEKEVDHQRVAALVKLQQKERMQNSSTPENNTSKSLSDQLEEIREEKRKAYSAYQAANPVNCVNKRHEQDNQDKDSPADEHNQEVEGKGKEKIEEVQEEDNKIIAITELECGTLSETFPLEVIDFIIQRCVDNSSSKAFLKNFFNVRRVCKCFKMLIDDHHFTDFFKDKESLEKIIKKINLPISDSPFRLRAALKEENLADIYLFARLSDDINGIVPKKLDPNGIMGETALTIASKMGLIKAIKLLLSLGADINKADRSGRTALYNAFFESTKYAAAKRFESIKAAIKLLLEQRADVNYKDNEGKGVLLSLLSNPHGIIPSDDIIELLLEYNADLNETYQQDSFPLKGATRKKLSGVVKCLLNKKACVDKEDSMGRSSLMWAVEDGALTIIDLLLEHGANPNKVDVWGISTLYHAVVAGNPFIVKSLLDCKNIKVDLGGNLENTPLCAACEKGYSGIVKLLLAAGANPEHITQKGKSPLSIAQEKGHTKIIVILKKWIAKKRTSDTPVASTSNEGSSSGT